MFARICLCLLALLLVPACGCDEEARACDNGTVFSFVAPAPVYSYSAPVVQQQFVYEQRQFVAPVVQPIYAQPLRRQRFVAPAYTAPVVQPVIVREPLIRIGRMGLL